MYHMHLVFLFKRSSNLKSTRFEYIFFYSCRVHKQVLRQQYIADSSSTNNTETATTDKEEEKTIKLRKWWESYVKIWRYLYKSENKMAFYTFK